MSVMSTPARRPWRVIPGYTTGRSITFEAQGNGIPVRTYATEQRAREVADDMVNRADGYFPAVRLSGPDWPIGDVDEYRRGQPMRRINVIDEAQRNLALWNPGGVS
jgi:hypothetical protein